MLNVTPSVRAALVGSLLTTILVIVIALAFASDLRSRSGQATANAMLGQARVLAAAFEAVPGDIPAVQATFDAMSLRDKLSTFIYTDGDGRVLAATDTDIASQIDQQFLAGTPLTSEPTVGQQATPEMTIVTQPVGEGPFRVAVAAPSAAFGLPARTAGSALAIALAAWGLILGLLVCIAWYAGPYSANLLEKLSQRIARDDADVSALIRHAEGSLGSLATALNPLGGKMRSLGKLRNEAREHVAALYQINPNYVLLCTIEGKVIEANPAFYAITGLSPEDVRGAGIGVLDDVMDIEPLREYAHRSLLEGSAIFGLEQVLMSVDDEPRPVEVALRAFQFGENQVMLIQATDLAVRRKLERRVSAFSDTLDLMVDQRVAQLTAGQQSLRRVLDQAGLIVASFDASGGTRRWSGGARSLTRRPASQVSNFTAVVDALGLTEADRSAFSRWFWSPALDPISMGHDFPDGAGGVRSSQVVWHCVESTEAGSSDARTLIGLELPIDGAPADYGKHSGDGLSMEPVQPT